MGRNKNLTTKAQRHEEKVEDFVSWWLRGKKR